MVKKIVLTIIISSFIGILLYPFYCWYGYGVNIFLNGFKIEDSVTYYYENGILSVGAKEIDGDYYYFASDGHMISDALVSKGGKFAYFDDEGKLTKGKLIIDEVPIYIDDDYHLQKDIDYLGDTVEEIISEYDNVEFSVYFKDLSSDQTLIINDEPMYPCSIIKIGVMASVFMQIAEGNLSYEECYPYLWAMITYSDNTSYNILLKMIGNGDALKGAEVTNHYLSSCGLNATQIHHGLLEGDYYFTDGSSNISSAKDIGILLELINDNMIVDELSCSRMKQLLLACEDNTGLQSGLPTDVAYAHKTGWAYDYYHDGGIVDDDYILVVFSKGLEEHQEAMSKISLAVYEYDQKFNHLLEEHEK